MTVSTSAPDSAGTLDRGGSSLADVVETVLDKGVVIDAQVTAAVLGIQLLEVDARVVIASVETYLRFAEAVDRIDIRPDAKGVPDLVEDTGKAAAKGKTASQLGSAAKEISGAVADSVRGRDSDEEGQHRSREKER